MKELEIIVDTPGAEKKIVITSGLISFDLSKDSIFQNHEISTVVIAGNGNFPPPFTKGSRVLSSMRLTSGHSFNNWKRVLPLQQDDVDYFKFPIQILNDKEEESAKENWGVWICESLSDKIPDLILINFPLWRIARGFKNFEVSKSALAETLSFTYRLIFSAVSTVANFRGISKKMKSATLALSDIGNNLIDRSLFKGNLDNSSSENEIYKLRIRVYAQVLSDWLARTDEYTKAIISYGEGFQREWIERAWDIQAQDSKNDLAEFGDALVLRNKSLILIKELLHSTKRKSLQGALKMAKETFSAPQPSLAADLIQSRSLVEAISLEFCHKYSLKAKEANLFAYIQRIEESKKVSPWVTSYFHVIRQLGNEAAHYKAEVSRRPENPVGKDLVVIHAALNRILVFCKDENL